RNRTGTHRLRGPRLSKTVLESTWERPNWSRGELLSSSFEHCLEHVTCQSRILPQTANGISVPVAAKRDVHPDVVSGSADDIPQLLIHTQQHLEFICRRRQLQIPDDSQCLPDHQLIVRGDTDVGAVPQQLLENVGIVSVNHPHVMVRDFAGLNVYALAEAVIRP